MILTVFLAIVFCDAITLMLISAVAFIQDKKLFSSAPKEAQKVIMQKESELFYGARVMGYMLIAFSFLLMRFRFFQHYFPESTSVMEGRRYGFNIKSQLLKQDDTFIPLTVITSE